MVKVFDLNTKYPLSVACRNGNIEIVKLILERLGKPESLISYVEDRKGHDYRYAIDPTKLKEEFGWEPKTMFKDGIVKTIDWYLAHPEYLMK